MEEVKCGNMNPLEIPLILEQIFNNLDKGDLTSCRQVSKLWHDNSLKVWRSSVKVTISMENENNKRSMTHFLNLVTSENCNHLNKPFITNYFLSNIENPPRFWSVNGNTIKQLSLYLVKFRSLDDLRNVIYDSCPNLERLELVGVEVAGPKASVDEPTALLEPQFRVNRNLKHLLIPRHYCLLPSWMELLAHFPSINILTLNRDTSNYAGLLRSLSLIRETYPNNLKLKHIKVNDLDIPDIRAPLLNVVKDTGHPLVSLEVSVYSPREVSQFQDILTFHAGSLRKLVLYGDFRPQALDPMTFFPSPAQAIMDSLEELQLGNELFSSLTFLKFIPNIRKLVLKGYNRPFYPQTVLSEMDRITLAWCDELEINYSSSRVTEGEVFRKLMCCVPNLKRFKSEYLGNDDFSFLCENLPGLVSLDIYAPHINDCVLTGLDGEDVVRINERGEGCVWRPITVPRVNITNFKDLQTLILRFDYETGAIKHSSQLCGIGQLSRLCQFNVTGVIPKDKLLEWIDSSSEPNWYPTLKICHQ